MLTALTRASEEERKFPGLFHSDSVCFLASRHLISLCSSCTIFIFFQCHLKHSLSSHSYIKTGRAADFSHQAYLIEQLHISLSSPCMWIKAVAQSFLLPENIKAICFVLWNVRSTGEIAKALAQLRCQWTAWATDRGREPQWQHAGKKGKPGVKERWGGEREGERQSRSRKDREWHGDGTDW